MRAMPNRPSKINRAIHRLRSLLWISPNRLLFRFAVVLMGAAPTTGLCADPSDPVLNLLLEKGVITEQEMQNARAEAEAIRTNNVAEMPQLQSKWKISKAIDSVELFGDLRVRYEQREAKSPAGASIQLDRGRYAVRLGLRGKALENFYYGLRLDTSSNPRSPWNTFGTSSSGVPYQGPDGKSTSGINVGQIYIGWRPEDWVDITVGRMSNPLYTTPMVWDTDLTPEGAAEHFSYRVRDAEFFATFGQFLYQDTNPNQASGGLGFNGLLGQKTDNIFQLAWQGGAKYQFTTNISAKAAATLYDYIGLKPFVSPYFGDVYVGEGAYLGNGIGGFVNGSSGYGTSYNNPSGLPNSLGFPNNQVGLDHLLVLEIPFEVNFKFDKFDARIFGDFGYNLDGQARAQAAASAYDYYLANYSTTPATITGFKAQTSDVKAYQIGVSLASKDGIGLVYGTTCHKHAWEARTYWQHVEQYALDPNLLDSDFFEGRANLEGIYAAVAYGFSDNVIGTVRYGYAQRINDKLGTGGSNLDIPQVNPVNSYDIFQMDLTFRF